MLVNFDLVFDEVRGAKHRQSLSSGEYLQRRNSQKEFKILDNILLDRVLDILSLETNVAEACKGVS